MSVNKRIVHVGSFVRRAIKERVLSVYKTAKLAGISQSVLNLIVNGKRGASRISSSHVLMG